MHPVARSFPAAVIALAIAHTASAQLFDVVSLPASGLVGSIELGANTAGTLIGNWKPDTNPTGTRTKPGAFGSFGSSENLPVNTSLGFGLEGDLNTTTHASFRLALNAGAQTASITNYQANFLADGPVDLPATISLDFDTFRTRSPDSTFPGLPITLPFGSFQLSSLSAVQAGPAGAGTLSPAGPNAYTLTLAVPVLLNASFQALDQSFDIDAIPFLLPILGQVTIEGDQLSLLATTPLDLENAFNPDLALPEFPLPVPTILPPGGSADLLFNLVLNEISTQLNATITLDARGTLVPTPSSAAILLASGLLASRRRRSLI